MRPIAQSLAKQPFGGIGISEGRQQEIDRGARRIDGPIQITPAAFDLKLGLIHTPRFGFFAGTIGVLGTAAGFAFVLLSGVTAWSLVRRDFASRPKLTDKDTIVLADFDNKTGDPIFDGTLRQGLTIQLEQSPLLKMSA